jgi:hypothetical protein
MIADIGGSFREGQAMKNERDFDNTLTEIVKNTPGYKYADLVKLDPQKATAYAQALGIPQNATERLQAAVGTITLTDKLLKGGSVDPTTIGALLLENANLYNSGGASSEMLQKSAQAFMSGDPQRIEAEVAAFNQMAAEFSTDDTKFSATTVSLPGGITVQNDTRGGRRVTDGAGQVLTGVAAENAIQAAEQSGSDRKTDEIRQGADARQTAARTSEIKQEFSQRSRDSAREQVTLGQAMKLVDKADQGIQGAAKLQLSRVFPDIDVTDEAMLSQSLTGLALDQLQKFKGPTTDFEFGVTESIAGSISDSKSANKARIASLDRANWFNQRESKQFNKFIAGDGNPDEFRFNFGERIKTKQGEFSLRDLQDTAVDGNMTIDQVLTRLNK